MSNVINFRKYLYCNVISLQSNYLGWEKTQIHLVIRLLICTFALSKINRYADKY